MTESIKVVALLGNKLHHKNTLATYLESGVNIVGVVFCDGNIKGIPINYMKIRQKKIGFLKLISQIIARVIYNLRNRNFDSILYNSIFDKIKIERIINDSKFNDIFCRKYSDPGVLDWISSLNPDIILCHTGEWIPKKIREIEGVKYIIGGHPGITQKYRGVHSPFWAILKGDYSSIGWTSFLIDSGVDSGDILDQGFLSLSDDTHSYFSISWLGMKEIALSHVRSIQEFTKTGHLKANKNRFLNPSSLYDLPGIFEQIRYWIVQRRFR